MIHHTCDRCCRIIDPDREPRYEVRIEIQSATDTQTDGMCDDDRDHLQELNEIIEQTGDDAIDDLIASSDQDHRYDLCAECYGAFVRNPVGREASVQLGFSQN